MTTRKVVSITVLTALSVILILVAILILAGPAGAKTTAKPSQQPLGCALASPADFTPQQNGIKFRNSGNLLQATSSTPLATFVARIEPPNSTTITLFRLAAIDALAARIDAKLYRQDLATGGRDLMAEVSTTGNVPADVREFDDATIASAAVDTSLYTYFVWVQFTSSGPKLKLVYAEVGCA